MKGVRRKLWDRAVDTQIREALEHKAMNNFINEGRGVVRARVWSNFADMIYEQVEEDCEKC